MLLSLLPHNQALRCYENKRQLVLHATETLANKRDLFPSTAVLRSNQPIKGLRWSRPYSRHPVFLVLLPLLLVLLLLLPLPCTLRHTVISKETKASCDTDVGNNSSTSSSSRLKVDWCRFSVLDLEAKLWSFAYFFKACRLVLTRSSLSARAWSSESLSSRHADPAVL